jgi:enoyl-[acyl-carrier protein] reductase II
MGGIGGQIEGLSRERSAFAMGQGAGAIHEVMTAAEIVREIMAEAEDVIGRMAKLARG